MKTRRRFSPSMLWRHPPTPLGRRWPAPQIQMHPRPQAPGFRGAAARHGPISDLFENGPPAPWDPHPDRACAGPAKPPASDKTDPRHGPLISRHGDPVQLEERASLARAGAKSFDGRPGLLLSPHRQWRDPESSSTNRANPKVCGRTASMHMTANRAGSLPAGVF